MRAYRAIYFSKFPESFKKYVTANHDFKFVIENMGAIEEKDIDEELTRLFINVLEEAKEFYASEPYNDLYKIDYVLEKLQTKELI